MLGQSLEGQFLVSLTQFCKSFVNNVNSPRNVDIEHVAR